MPQDGTGRPDAPTRTHLSEADPSWCHPDECTIESFHPYGYHGSFMYSVEPDNSVFTVVYMRITQLPGRVQPPLATLEISDSRTRGENAEAFPLTPAQLRRLHNITGALLAAITAG
jgi:hypothetical protein